MGLTRAGWLAAACIGAATIAGGRWPFVAVLLTFFVTSMLLSRLHQGKHERRNVWQVLANGAIAGGCALACALTRSPAAAAAFAGAFAAANADTWATEIGTRLGGTPRSIITGRSLPKGLSGGITPFGTGAELAGALLVGAVAGALHVAGWWIVAVAGICGSTADSLAGALVQQRRYCATCEVECETGRHECGTLTRHSGGLGWLRNDAVNFLCTGTGAAVAAALTALR